MKILHVIATLDKKQGGPPPVVTGMCAALTARGHQVTLFANESAEPYLSSAASPFELVYFPVDWGAYQISWSMARKLRDLQHFDIVHTHMLYRFPQTMAAHQARRQKIPYCVQPHGALAPTVYHGKRRLGRAAYVAAIERHNIEKAAGVIFTASQELAWASELGLAPPRPFVVPVGADIAALSRRADGSAFRTRHGLDDGKIVMWMGRLVASKGGELLVSAFAQAAQAYPDLRLVLAGPDTGNCRPSLENLARALGVDGRLVFTGMIEGEEKLQALGAADLFAFPSESENFGLAALEAMASGVPVLLSPGVSIAADIAAAGAGKVVRRDVASWSGAIMEMMGNNAQRDAMGEAAKQAAWRYDWSNVIEVLEDTYRTVLGHS